MLRVISIQTSILLTGLLSLVSCTLTPDAPVPSLPKLKGGFQFRAIEVEDVLAHDTQPSCISDPLITRSFFSEDTELQKLLVVARAHNLDVRAAGVRILESQAKSDGTWATMLPTLSLRLSMQRGDNEQARQDVAALSPQLAKIAGQPKGANTQYRSQLGVSGYEVDIWGRLRSTHEAANADLLAQKEFQELTIVELQSEVMIAYYELLYAARSRRILLDQVVLTNAVESHAAALVQHGLLSIMDFRQRQLDRRFVEKEITSIDQQIHLLYGRLYGLTGLTELLQRRDLELRANPSITKFQFDHPIDSSFVLLRPDVALAELNIVQANGKIGAARAAFLPMLKLDLNVQRSADQFSDVFAYAGKGWSLTPSLFASVFDFGKNIANLELAKTQATAALLEYQRSLVRAYQDIQAAVDRIGIASRQLQESQQQLDLFADFRARRHLARQGRQLSEMDILQTEMLASEMQMDNVGAERALVLSGILLYKALGGRYVEPCKGLGIKADS